MKNLKILFLAVALLFPCVSMFAQDNPAAGATSLGVGAASTTGASQRGTRPKNPPKYTVNIIISDTEELSVEVDSAVVTFNDEFLQSKLPKEFNTHSDGKVLIWKIDGVKSGEKIVQDVSAVAVWVPESEWILMQDTAMWKRSFQSFVIDLLSDSNSAELTEQDKKGDLWLYVILGLAILLSIVSILLSILLPIIYQKRLQDKVVDIVRGSDRLKNWRDDGKVDAKTTVVSNTSYDGDIRELRNRVSDLEDKLRNATKENTNTVVTSISSSQGKTAVSGSSAKHLYADSIVNGKFNKVKETPGDDSIFELNLKGDSKANVTIYKQAYNKVLANPSYLEGCEKQMPGNTSVHIDREGTAEKDDNGKWKLVNPLKVVLK